MAFFHLALIAALALAVSADGSCSDFLLLCRPSNRQIVYACLPSRHTRQLFWDANISPTKIAVDQLHSRLYMVDSRNVRIVWTNLITSGEGTKLMTDGQIRNAAQNMDVKTMTIDPHGNLFFTGKSTLPNPGVVVDYQIYKQSLGNINSNTDVPQVLWASGEGVTQPADMITDGFSLYWVNGQEESKVVLAAAGVGGSRLATKGVRYLVEDVPVATSVALGPRHVYYCRDNKVFGMPRSSAVGGTVALINDQCEHCSGLTTDGENTGYAACNGEVFSFATGELGLQDLNSVLEQPDLGSIALLHTSGSGAMAIALHVGALALFAFLV